MNTLLPFFGVIRVTGDDRHEFLHNQFSNDIQNLSDKTACYATYNTPKGRVIANMLAYCADDAVFLILAADLAEKVAKRLRMFVLRAKVQMEVLGDWGVAGCLPENAPVVYPSEPKLQLSCNEAGQIELPHGGCLTLAPKSDLPAHDVAAESAWNRHEILCGYPWISAATSETCVAQMLNQHTIGGVHFRKGCYPGQEIIARAQYRGQVKRGLAVAKNAVPQPAGAPVQDAQQAEAGIVINQSGSLHLLVVKHAAAQHDIFAEDGSPFAVQHLFFATDDQGED